MMRIGNSNPVFRSVRTNAYAGDVAVTYTDVAIKTIILILITGAVGVYTYTNFNSVISYPLLIGAAILGFVSVLIGTRNVNASPVFSVLYAISEGYILGLVSAIYAFYFDGSGYEGIVPTAIATTLVVLLITMLLYSMGIVRVGQRFASFLVIGLISVIIMSLLSIFISFGTFYYVIVIFSAILSVLFLFYDFENIHTCVESGTDKKYSWVLALGLMVTIVWVYVEILRLLAIFARRR